MTAEDSKRLAEIRTLETDQAPVCDNCDEHMAPCAICRVRHCPDCDPEGCAPLDVAREKEASEMQRGWDEVKNED